MSFGGRSASALRFGTDGIRARAYDQLTVADVEALAVAAGKTLGGAAFVIGADTRESGPDFVHALTSGLARCGIDAWDLGVAPTPAVAWVAAEYNVAGAVVSASHNPYYDNGIKFFAPGGRKLSDSQQTALEAELNAPQTLEALTSASSVDKTDLVADYLRSVRATIAPNGLAGIEVVIDCANGAASAVAASTLQGLGASVTAINDAPNGRNINDACGSTDMTQLRQAVTAGAATVGIAFDGDADRMLAVDQHGEFVDGDQIIAICALDRAASHQLTDNAVVVTVMTNLGFRLAMEASGLNVHVTPVGDRHVLEALHANGWSLGGEQSGHVIFADVATTGDGLLTAVQLLDVVARSGQSLAELADAAMTRLPQRLRSVPVVGTAAQAMTALADDIARVDRELGDTGRLLVRPSGTEPLIRVMAEAPTQSEADAAVDELVGILEGLSSE